MIDPAPTPERFNHSFEGLFASTSSSRCYRVFSFISAKFFCSESDTNSSAVGYSDAINDVREMEDD